MRPIWPIPPLLKSLIIWLEGVAILALHANYHSKMGIQGILQQCPLPSQPPSPHPCLKWSHHNPFTLNFQGEVSTSFLVLLPASHLTRTCSAPNSTNPSSNVQSKSRVLPQHNIPCSNYGGLVYTSRFYSSPKVLSSLLEHFFKWW